MVKTEAVHIRSLAIWRQTAVTLMEWGTGSSGGGDSKSVSYIPFDHISCYIFNSVLRKDLTPYTNVIAKYANFCFKNSENLLLVVFRLKTEQFYSWLQETEKPQYKDYEHSHPEMRKRYLNSTSY